MSLKWLIAKAHDATNAAALQAKEHLGFACSVITHPMVEEGEINDGPFDDPVPSDPELKGIEENAWLMLQWQSKLANDSTGILYEMAFVYRIALFDAFVSDVLVVLFVHRQDLLKTDKKQISYAGAISMAESGTLIEFLAAKEVEAFTFRPFLDQMKWLEQRLQYDILQSDKNILESLNEIVARRNLLVHANGVVNDRYVAAVGSTSLTIGERAGVSRDYYTKADSLLQLFTLGLQERLAAMAT